MNLHIENISQSLRKRDLKVRNSYINKYVNIRIIYSSKFKKKDRKNLNQNNRNQLKFPGTGK